MNEPLFLSTEDVLLIHDVVVQEHGGAAGVRDGGLLESAISQPRASFGGSYLHSYPSGMAAAYGFHLAKNHPFVDGNKRAAWAVLRQFLLEEGFRLDVPVQDGVAVMLAVAEGRIDKAGLESWIAVKIVRRARLELRTFFKNLESKSLVDKLIAITDSYRSGGLEELTAIFSDASRAMPVIRNLMRLYDVDRRGNEQVIHYIRLLAALHRIAEDQGYEW